MPRRVAKLILAAVLAPVLLLGLPYVGPAAASVAGPWKNSVETDSGGIACVGICPDQAVNCHFQARWGGLDDIGDVSTTLEIRNGYCDSWALNRPPEDVIFTGSGGLCPKEIDITADQTSWALNPHREWSFSGSITTAPGCDIDSWQIVINGANDVFGTIDLGDAEVSGVAADGCVAQLVDIEIQDHMGVGSGPDWPMATNIYYRRVMVTVHLPPTGVDHLWLDSSLAWTGGSSPGHSSSQSIRLIGAGGDATFNAAHPFPTGGGNFTFPLPYLEAAAGDPRASGWFAASSTAEGAWTGLNPASASGAIVIGTEGAIVNNDFRAAPPNPKPFHLGAYPDGTDCTYWMNMTGTPIADHTAAPAGPVDDTDPGTVTTPATDEGSGDGGSCSFSFTSPSTWATAGICALVKLMRQAVAWLGQIAAAISGLADDIVSGIAGLFVPPDGAFDDAFDGARADFTASDMGGWSTSTGGMFSDISTAGSSSDCTGPSLSLSLPGSTPVTLQPLNACTAPMSTVAALVRLLLGLFAVVGGLFTAVSLLGSALGMSVQPPTWQQGELF